VRLLLDTHAALWFLSADARLGPDAFRHLQDEDNQLLLSSVVVWEVAVKRSLGKLNAPEGFAEAMLSSHVQPLPVTIDHAAAVEHLPWQHRDPFDRMLVAQARLENLPVATIDRVFRDYGVAVIW
jgi:PIN domain nuclease of toxin-antitoxin system